MNIKRAILSGVIIWLQIFVVFAIMSFIPRVKDSELQKNIIIYVLLIPIMIVGLKFYYKKVTETNGLIPGALIALTGLSLDTIITIPAVIIPLGGSYISFYMDPFLWGIVAEMLVVSYLYWKMKIE